MNYVMCIYKITFLLKTDQKSVKSHVRTIIFLSRLHIVVSPHTECGVQVTSLYLYLDCDVTALQTRSDSPVSSVSYQLLSMLQMQCSNKTKVARNYSALFRVTELHSNHFM